MSKARDLANAGTALTTVSATELGYLDGVTSAVQTQVDAKIAKSTVTAKGDLLVATGSGTVVAQAVGTNGQYLQADSTQSDGVKWADVTTLPSQTSNSGKYLTTDGTTASWGTVTQPVNFTMRIAGNGSAMNKIEYNGSNLYVAVGTAGNLYTSSNGTTWTSRTSGFGANTINDVAYGNGLWVAVGGNGTLTTSTDGITWTARTANMSTNQIRQVIYANSLWVAVGAGGGTTNTGGITYSTDGITWTRKSQSVTVGGTYYCVTWNGTNWIVGTNPSTNNYLYATTPSGTWTAAVTNGGQSVGNLFWDGTRAIWHEGTDAFISTSTTLASAVNMSGGVPQFVNNTSAVRYYNNKIYGTNGFYLQSYTPQSTAYPISDSPIFAPVKIQNTSGSGNWLEQSINCIYIGAAGYILGGNLGQIWTSF